MIFDPFKPGPRDQLPQVLAELRERFPVYRTDSDIWVLSRFDDVKAVQSNPQQFSSRPNPYEGSAPPDEEMKPEVLERLLALAAGIPVDMAEMASAKTIAAADPPQHTRMRRIVSRGFTPPRIKEMATVIEEIVERCMAGIEDQPAFDVVERLAVPLPVEMICHILGIDRSHYSPAKRWSDAFAAAAGGVFSSPAERNELMLSTVKEFSTYFVPLIEARRIEPRNDLVSAMVAAIDKESLSNVETLMVAITIMVAGNETIDESHRQCRGRTTGQPRPAQAVCSTILRLLPNAVDEANRLTCPIQFAFREATEDTEIAGTPIPKGAIIALHMAAANRDPRRFDDPDCFLINRPPGKNLSFGHGIHFCLGAHLAGQEVRTAVGGLLPYLDRLELTDAPLQRNPTALLNGWQRVELAWVC